MDELQAALAGSSVSSDNVVIDKKGLIDIFDYNICLYVEVHSIWYKHVLIIIIC